MSPATERPAHAGYPFLGRMGRILNSGQSRSIALTGQVFDLFFLPPEDDAAPGDAGRYVPLLHLLLARWDAGPQAKHFIKVIYGPNKPIQFLHEDDLAEVRDAWMRLQTGVTQRQRAIERLARPYSAPDREPAADFDALLEDSARSPARGLELLRQMCLASRTPGDDGSPLLERDLIILIEGADMLVPEGEIARLSEADRQRIAICRDWFSDFGFAAGNDSVILIAESRSQLSQEIARLPQLLEVEVPAPDAAQRGHFISWFIEKQPDGRKPRLWSTGAELADLAAGLSVQAVMQMLKESAHTGEVLRPADVVAKVEEFLKAQMGEDVVEFHKPAHTLQDVVGNARLKEFLATRFIPRLKTFGKGSIAGAVVAGPNRGGKSYIFEAVAAELGIVVLVLKNIRSMWFGQTDVLFERLRRCLMALSKVLIFVDEADTQFGPLGPEAHATERRLTGKIQNMMADPRLRGRVLWLLLTARVHLLPADIRQPGRAGDLIIPVLDPEGEDLEAFVRWVLGPVADAGADGLEAFVRKVAAMTKGYSAGALASLRDELLWERARRDSPLPPKDILAVIQDRLPPDVARDRRFQVIQALLNCTHRSLLPPEAGKDVERFRNALRLELVELLGGRA